MRSFLLLCAVSLTAVIVCSDEPVKTESPWQKLFRQEAAEYRFEFQNQPQKKAQVSREPVLFWSQPVRGGDDGGVFLWSSAGRPVAIGTFFIWPPAEGGQSVTHEL